MITSKLTVNKKLFEDIKAAISAARGGEPTLVETDDRGQEYIDIYNIDMIVKELTPKQTAKCDDCGHIMLDHCKVHMIPCCPGKCVADPDVKRRLGL